MSDSLRGPANSIEPGALVVAKLIRGAPLESLAPQISQLEEPWKELAQFTGLAEVERRREVVTELVGRLADPGPVLEQVMNALDATKPRLDGHSEVPVLPTGALLEPAEHPGGGALLKDYVRYSKQVSPMTPRSFHVSAGLWLTSVVVARRLVARMPFGLVYPNLFMVWVAPTTLFRKTTALDVAARFAREIVPHLLASEDATPEALIADMAGEEPSNLDRLSPEMRTAWEAGRLQSGQRGWLLDELSGLLARSNKDYNAGLIETLIKLFDCQDERRSSTRTHGLLVVRNAYLSLLAASTPEALAPSLTKDLLWTIGWWPRFALLAPEDGTPPYRRATPAEKPHAFLDQLRSLRNRLPMPSASDPAAAIEVRLQDGVEDALETYSRATSYDLLLPGDVDARLYGTYGRLATMVLKVAMLLVALDWETGEPEMSLGHLARAQWIVEEWRRSAHRLLAKAGFSEYDRLRGRICAFLAKEAPQWAKRRSINRALPGVKPDQIDDALRQMVSAGEVETEHSESGPRGGRPTDCFRLARG